MYIAHTCICQISLGGLGALRVRGTVDLRDGLESLPSVMNPFLDTLNSAEGTEGKYIAFIENSSPHGFVVAGSRIRMSQSQRFREPARMVERI